MSDMLTQVTIEGLVYSVPSSWKPVRPLGHQCYGHATVFNDTAEDTAVCVLPLNDAATAATTLSQVRLLRLLEHENVAPVERVLPYDPAIPTSLFCTRPFMPGQLSKIMKKSLSEGHITYLLYQLLNGLKYVHSAGLIIKEMKPSTIVVDTSCGLKLVDVGWPDGHTAIEDAVHADAPVRQEECPTHWYTAPEVLMCSPTWGAPANIWSAGCIFAEFLAQRPLFPGKNIIHQLTLETSLLRPNDKELQSIAGHPKAQSMIKFIKGQMGKGGDRTIASVFSFASAPAIELLSRMLTFDPVQRITADAGLRLPYLEGDFDDDDMIDAPCVVPKAAVTVSVQDDASVPLVVSSELKDWEASRDTAKRQWAEAGKMAGAGAGAGAS